MKKKQLGSGKVDRKPLAGLGASFLALEAYSRFLVASLGEVHSDTESTLIDG